MVVRRRQGACGFGLFANILPYTVQDVTFWLLNCTAFQSKLRIFVSVRLECGANMRRCVSVCANACQRAPVRADVR